MIKILDCTLRDGGYVLDHMFDELRIKGIISQLCDAKIDVIEVGFLKDTAHKRGSTLFNRVEEILEYLPKQSQSSFVAMMDYGRYSVETLSKREDGYIDAIRNCFFKKDFREAISVSKVLMKKGYDVYIQPVDILSYDDNELLELISYVNDIDPDVFSVVDTFGSMYIDDLVRIFTLIDHNLKKHIKLGFHSHNNLQLSFALSQKFIELGYTKRDIIIDSTICGLGRGAGNTNTELLVDFLNKKYDAGYELNKLLDLIDTYMNDIIYKYQWGYTIPHFIAGIHGAHVHNVSYLLDKHNLNVKDLRNIVESIDDEKIKRYDYENLDKLHKEYFTSHFDDSKSIKLLSEKFATRSVLILAPGSSLETYREDIKKYIETLHPLVISVNFIAHFPIDYCFYSNAKKYTIDKDKLLQLSSIKTSNLEHNSSENSLTVNYENLVRLEGQFSDNSVLMVLRLLNSLNVEKVCIAGFDGFGTGKNYTSEFKAAQYDNKERNELLNQSIRDMLVIFNLERQYELAFLTPSHFSDIFEE